jgi:hypothetical protein
MLWWRSDNQGTFECTMYRVQSDIRQAEIAQVCQQLLVNTKSEREGGYFKDADRNRSPWQIRRPEKQGKFRFVIRKQDRTGRQGQGSSGDVIGSARNPSREKCKTSRAADPSAYSLSSLAVRNMGIHSWLGSDVNSNQAVQRRNSKSKN